jgi:enoyl-CoA hydratase
MNQGDNVSFKTDGSIGILTLDQPPGYYLAAPEFIPVALFREWTGNEELKGLIITGAGKNFSAGGDLDRVFSAAGNGQDLQHLVEAGHRLFSEIRGLEIPVVAAVNRVCFGGGLEIALACHFRVASENALLAFPEVNSNLMPGMGGTLRLPALVGPFRSAQMILGGDMISATDAMAMGLVDHVAPRDQAFEFALNLLQKMTRDRPVKVIRYIMKALKNSAELSPEAAILEETRLFCDLARDESERRKSENGN